MISNIKLGLLLVVPIVLSFYPVGINAKTVDELREELRSKRGELQDAESKIQKFKDEIQLKKRETSTLKDQISIIEENIEEVELSLERTDLEIETVNLEIDTVNEEIAEREAEIKHQKTRLAGLIRQLHELDQQSTVAVMLKYNTFSEAVQEASTFEELQNRGQEALNLIQKLRDELNQKRNQLEDFRQTLEALKFRQEREQATLSAQRTSKERILELTHQQEQEYQLLLKSAQETHQKAQSQIKNLDAQIREELRRQGIGNLPSVGIFDWPINPSFGVSCEFHCSGYPYAYLIGPHSGIDIPAYVGTPIKAPADGYIARTFNAGGPGYSYILMIHGDNLSTVYGHVSGFAVAEGTIVTRGTVIGYTGGAPGSNGAGLSTGPHLHFEVRENNSAINPRKFL